jgi:glycosyltransferase involved in cell wall biosynthesis
LNGEGAALINASKSGLTCASGDHAGLAEAVLKLSKMTNEERKLMGLNGLATSAREFDRDTLITQLEMLLRQLCGEVSLSITPKINS